MKFSKLVRALPIVVFLFIVESVHADIRVCNRSDNEIRYIYLNENLGLFNMGWLIEGWIQLFPKECSYVNRTIDRQRAYFSIISIIDGKGVLMNFPEGNIRSRSHWRDGWHGTQGVSEFFCVKSTEFRRNLSSPSEAKRCPSGYYKQFFNLELRTAGHAHQTLDIN